MPGASFKSNVTKLTLLSMCVSYQASSVWNAPTCGWLCTFCSACPAMRHSWKQLSVKIDDEIRSVFCCLVWFFLKYIYKNQRVQRGTLNENPRKSALFSHTGAVKLGAPVFIHIPSLGNLAKTLCFIWAEQSKAEAVGGKKGSEKREEGERKKAAWKRRRAERGVIGGGSSPAAHSPSSPLSLSFPWPLFL